MGLVLLSRIHTFRKGRGKPSPYKLPIESLYNFRMLTDISFTFHSTSRTQTVQVGALLGSLLSGGDIICLSGDLGAGKTAITSGIAAGWGAVEAVSSPTFTFVHEHSRTADSMRLYHVDCYRLSLEADADSIGLAEMTAGSDIVILEWPERVESLLPPDRLWITLEQGESDSDRIIEFATTGARYVALIDNVAATFAQKS